MTVSAIIFQIQSILIIATMIYGISQAKKRLLHKKIMSFAMAWDVLLILQIEFTRHAVEKAISLTDNSIILNIHLFLAVTTVLFYPILIILGRKIISGQKSLIPIHRLFGRTTIIFRILTFITSFYVI